MISYTSLHWGDSPNRTENLSIYVGQASPVGTIEAISYITSKNGRVEIYRHEFEGEPPILLCGRSGGPVKAPTAPTETIALGRLVDIELTDGRRCLFGLCWLVTNKSGSNLWIASRNPIKTAIKKANSVPTVTDAGIVA